MLIPTQEEFLSEISDSAKGIVKIVKYKLHQRFVYKPWKKFLILCTTIQKKGESPYLPWEKCKQNATRSVLDYLNDKIRIKNMRKKDAS